MSIRLGPRSAPRCELCGIVILSQKCHPDKENVIPSEARDLVSAGAPQTDRADKNLDPSLRSGTTIRRRMTILPWSISATLPSPARALAFPGALPIPAALLTALP